MPKLRISIVEFLNTAPLVWGFAHGPLKGRYDLSYTVPSRCAEDLRAGRADVAIIPSIEYQRIPNLVALPEISIAAKDEVRSILLLAKKPIEKATRIALDTNSRSSVALTRLLCRGLWRIEPEFVDAPPDPTAMLANADAALLIGDPALRIRLQVDTIAAKAAANAGKVKQAGCGCLEWFDPPAIAGVKILFLYDVAYEWRRMTAKPCVLAIWAGRREAITPEVVADFMASRDYGLAHIGEIAENAAMKLDEQPRALEQYLRENIDFSLDAANLDGLQHYFKLCAEAGLIPAARPVEFAPLPHIATGASHAAGLEAR